MGIVVDPGPLEFDALTLAILLRRHQPALPLYFFGSARDLSTVLEIFNPDTTRCYKSPFEISELSKAILASSLRTRGLPHGWRRGNGLLRRALEFIDVNYPTITSVTYISTHLGVSREHLTREFTRTVGHTLWDFLTTYRLEKAKELLGGGFLVKQVFDEVGFKCESSFFRAFMKHTGTTPGMFRETALARNPVIPTWESSRADARRAVGRQGARG
ncbi:MAG: helix-turn-helix transcriptional regulator [Candidatus Eiseniibacteriota bacterium]|nr:MAG: helix-turn-helix transcriptional regulator [Candidatus Eisenbacteria bacterium]